jgi:hypothetical protein
MVLRCKINWRAIYHPGELERALGLDERSGFSGLLYHDLTIYIYIYIFTLHAYRELLFKSQA